MQTETSSNKLNIIACLRGIITVLSAIIHSDLKWMNLVKIYDINTWMRVYHSLLCLVVTVIISSVFKEPRVEIFSNTYVLISIWWRKMTLGGSVKSF